MSMSETTKESRTITGRVTSNKMDKSITVMIERKIPHPLYKKYIKRSSKVQAHDEDNQCNEGDVVVVTQCRPKSKNKSWRLEKIVTSAV